MRSVQSRAATRGDHENFHITTLLSVLCTARVNSVGVAAIADVFAVSTSSTLAALRVPSAACPAHHSSAWRESNPFVSHQGASPFVAASCGGAPHVVRTLRAARIPHPLHPCIPCRPCRPCRTRADSRDAIRRHQRRRRLHLDGVRHAQQLVRARRHRLAASRSPPTAPSVPASAPFERPSAPRPPGPSPAPRPK